MSEFVNEENSVNEEQENVVDSQTDESQNDSLNEESENSQEVAKPEQSKEDNAVAAAVRRKVETELKTKYERELAERDNRLNKIKDLTGQDPDDIIADLEKQARDSEISEMAEKNNLPPHVAKEVYELRKEQEQIKQQLTSQTMEKTLAEQKKALREKPYYAELETEIDETLQKFPRTSPELAYKLAIGNNIDTLLKKASASTAQTVNANIADRANKGTVTSDGAADSDIAIDMEMAAAFGNDPKDIRKYIKKTKRK
jgi:hypothetical protein